jgi:hypothetical protein
MQILKDKFYYLLRLLSSNSFIIGKIITPYSLYIRVFLYKVFRPFVSAIIRWNYKHVNAMRHTSTVVQFAIHVLVIQRDDARKEMAETCYIKIDAKTSRCCICFDNKNRH